MGPWEWLLWGAAALGILLVFLMLASAIVAAAWSKVKEDTRSSSRMLQSNYSEGEKER